MGLTHFPHGVASFGMPIIGSGPVFTTGKVFFVGNQETNAADSPAHGGSPDKPFNTLDYAVGQCRANKGDFIILMPGHSEAITAAAEIDLDVAGITVLGIGTGSLQPKILLDATAAEIEVNAANITVRNVHFQAGAADVTICLDVNANDFWLDECRFTDAAANENFVDYIHVGSDGVADGLKVTRCWAVSPDTGNDGFINAAGDIDRLVFCYNYISLGVAANEPVIEAAGKSLTNCLIAHNYILRLQTAGDVFLASDQTDNSGIVAYNVVGHADVDSAGAAVDLTGARMFENYGVGEADASGLLIPDVTDEA